MREEYTFRKSSDPLIFDPMDNMFGAGMETGERIDEVEDLLRAEVAAQSGFDRLTRVAALCIAAPISLVSIVSSDRQEFLGACGLSEDLDRVRQTPIGDSLCRHAVVSGNLLIIPDVFTDTRVVATPLLRQKNIRAYLGCPLITERGVILGSFCVIDHRPRKWSPEEIDLVCEFAALAVEKIEDNWRSGASNGLAAV